MIVDLAKAYIEENEKPCWEDIVVILCKHLNKIKFASRLSEDHNIDYNRLCK